MYTYTQIDVPYLTLTIRRHVRLACWHQVTGQICRQICRQNLKEVHMLHVTDHARVYVHTLSRFDLNMWCDASDIHYMYVHTYMQVCDK